MYTLRAAGPPDLDIIFDAVCQASDGVFEYLLAGKVASKLLRPVMLAVLKNSDSCFSPANILVAEAEGRIAGFLFAYPASEHSLPAQAAPLLDSKKLLALQNVLEATVPDTLHINCLWADSDYLTVPLREELLDMADKWARHKGLCGLSTFIWADAEDEVAFFTRNGFSTFSRIPANGLAVQGKSSLHQDGGVLLKRIFERS